MMTTGKRIDFPCTALSRHCREQIPTLRASDAFRVCYLNNGPSVSVRFRPDSFCPTDAGYENLWARAPAAARNGERDAMQFRRNTCNEDYAD